MKHIGVLHLGTGYTTNSITSTIAINPDEICMSSENRVAAISESSKGRAVTLAAAKVETANQYRA